MTKLVALLKKLWADEPVIVSTALTLAVSEGVLTASAASTVTDVVAGVLQTLAALGIRSRVSPTA